MERYIADSVKNDLSSKVVMISGPRQVGKTTLARGLYSDYEYFNYDVSEDRLVLIEKSWKRDTQLIIFDELHKMKRWKQWLKGVYDVENVVPPLLVTGSAKLDTYRKVGDSMAGRYFQHRLHPLDLKEAITLFPDLDREELLERLLICSGFPEPFLRADEQYYKRWRQTHLDIILRQDLIDLEAVKDIQAIETLVALLKKRVASNTAYQNLAQDLQRDATTIKRWINMLENLYVVFRVTPYHQNIARSLLKSPKLYFYDVCQVDHDEGSRFENLVACALLKELHRLEDTKGVRGKLHYLRTKEGHEVDFLVAIDDEPKLLIEVKLSDDSLNKGLQYFAKYFPDIPKLQLVKNLKREKTYSNGVQVCKATQWLNNVEIPV